MIRACLVPAALLAAALLGGCAGGASARDADAQFQSASDRAPTAQTLYNAARLMAHQGRDEEAIYVLRRVNRDYPAYAPAYCDLAECHMRANRNTEAVAVLNDGIAKAGEDAVLVNNLGICAMMKSDYEAALGHFTKAATLAPGNVRYRANMAAALGRMGRYDESLALYKQVVSPIDAHHNVGVLAEARKDTQRANAEFAEAARLEHLASARGSIATPNPAERTPPATPTSPTAPPPAAAAGTPPKA